MLLSGAISGATYAANEGVQLTKAKKEKDVEIIEVTGFRSSISNF